MVKSSLLLPASNGDSRIKGSARMPSIANMDLDAYNRFLGTKQIVAGASGFEVPDSYLCPVAFPYQGSITRWSLRRGKAAIFSRYGTGKTLMLGDWSRNVCRHTGRNVLIVSPLAVAEQTAGEFRKFNLGDATVCRTQDDVKPGMNITNYEMIEHFDCRSFVGVVLDESSALKHVSSKTRGLLIDSFATTPYKLCCTATPSPNDHVELGGHAEFLGIMKESEMLSMFFTHDGGNTSKWTIGQHAKQHFWKWVSSWSVMLRKPSDLGYSDEGFGLPELRMHEILVDSESRLQGYLVPVEATTLNERRKARKDSLENRVKKIAEIINASDDIWVVWCNLNAESAALKKAINWSVEVTGSDTREFKKKTALEFAAGKVNRLISKPSIFGHGMNWQVCHKAAFVGLSDSFEEMDQAIHRVYRFGQKCDVDIYVVTSDQEGSVVRNIQRKRDQFEDMSAELVKYVSVFHDKDGLRRDSTPYDPAVKMELPGWLKSEVA